MKKRLGKKWICGICGLAMLLSVESTTQKVAYARESESVATKTATKQNEEGKFGIEIKVPGEDGSNNHNEVILMVDGSYSTNSVWPDTRSAILKVGETVLGNGNTLLTIMTFGVGDNIVLEHVKSVQELDEALPSLPEGLLYGRSATNCEVGFKGIDKYIRNHDNTLDDVQIIYITDGDINTDETPYAWYNWTSNSWLKWDAEIIALECVMEEVAYSQKYNTVMSDAYNEVFVNAEPANDAEPADDAEPANDEEPANDAEPANDEEPATKTRSSKTESEEEKAMRYANLVWKNVYEYCGLNPEEAYTISDMERAFLKYDEDHNTHVQEIFYYSAYGRPFNDKNERTAEAGILLANNEKVSQIYLIDSKGTVNSWMQKIAESISNVSVYESVSSDWITVLEGVLVELSHTPYNDVIITDYMSKWVDLDKATIKIADNKTNQDIWTSKDGWLISETERPTLQEKPVIVEEVSSEDYEDGGQAVIGNEKGTVYKITWYVKDGAMLLNDNYSLIYEVDVDTLETGFQYNTEYPANGKTTLDYIEKDGEDSYERTENILVPNVIVNKETIPEETETKPKKDPETSETEPKKDPETSETEPKKDPEISETEPKKDSEISETKPETSVKEPETTQIPSTNIPKTGDNDIICYIILVMVVSLTILVMVVKNVHKKH